MTTKQKFSRSNAILTSVLGLAAFGFAGTATAETDASHYTVAVISDAAQGRKVLQGQYEHAIDSIRSPRRGAYARYYAANNLCVAYVMTRNVEAAATACENAITTMATMVKKQDNKPTLSGHAKAQRKFLAIALSNRGVLNAINGDEDLARADFKKALELGTRIEAPAINMARLSKQLSPQA